MHWILAGQTIHLRFSFESIFFAEAVLQYDITVFEDLFNICAELWVIGERSVEGFCEDTKDHDGRNVKAKETDFDGDRIQTTSVGGLQLGLYL
jgi:hypothetical protein